MNKTIANKIESMSDNLKIFRDEYLNANSWGQRKNGVPLDLLDNLSNEELEVAEKELIEKLSLKDDWPIHGLGHIKSQKALPKLYNLLQKSKKGMKVSIAHSIFQISKDEEMINVILTEMPKLKHWSEIIHKLYLLPTFKDEKIDALLNSYREHKDYLVAYNATQAMGQSKIIFEIKK
ncbi:hypothetical protein GTQ34_04140 [Muricauda sp. JGD-17]|uniref:Uncharacterized protein n=1 Tax=Flagellimonas ochracea TaxID=2696472 RepID=A0A964TBH5_9FLAO|nr:hypothetical protein [Allomuricauda ochracea]